MSGIAGAPLRWLRLLHGSPWLRWQIQHVQRQQALLKSLDDAELQRRSLALRYRAFSGEPATRLLPEAFALMSEAALRAVGLQPHLVQWHGGIAMAQRAVAEMQTGEGKTLTATLPLYLAALAGRGVHLATANDYLAERDAAFVRPAFELLGMTVGVLQSATPRALRQEAYRSDVTYAAAREFGFDFLRDRLLAGQQHETGRDLLGRMLGRSDCNGYEDPLQRELHWMLVDEADSILIDEARTPLIVSALPEGGQEAAAELYRWSYQVTPQFGPQDYEYDHRTRRVTLTTSGRRRARDLPRPPALGNLPLYDLYEHVERALRVEREFERDKHYVVRDGQIVIVDESTGRLAEGRKWRDGIHQAIEAREGVAISVATAEAARVTMQDFLLRYRHLSGMTGTAWPARQELKKIYRLKTYSIPTHRPVQRAVWPDAVFVTHDEKWQAIVDEVQTLHASGRPVLIGTRTIEDSEHLSRRLTAAGLDHQVLNAHRHEEEATVIAEAGKRGRITVATNMAGRGTDIQLGEEIAELGGLHVIGSELHESARIDRQLMGRCGRQGDPGSYRQFMALQDAILDAAYGPRGAARWRQRARRWSSGPGRRARLLRRAQARVEREHFRQRRMLMYHEKQRRQLQQEMGQDPFLDAAS